MCICLRKKCKFHYCRNHCFCCTECSSDFSLYVSTDPCWSIHEFWDRICIYKYPLRFNCCQEDQKSAQDQWPQWSAKAKVSSDFQIWQIQNAHLKKETLLELSDLSLLISHTLDNREQSSAVSCPFSQSFLSLDLCQTRFGIFAKRLFVGAPRLVSYKRDFACTAASDARS